MDKKLLHVLIIDDSPDDAQLVVETLRHAGYIVKSQRVQDMAGLLTATGGENWEVAITETDVPGLTVPAAIGAMHRAGHDIPCIIMTRTVSDGDMAELMAAGARDIVFKNQTSRLAPVIERELAVAHMSTELAQAREQLSQLQHRYGALMDGSLEAICYSQDGMHTSANPAYLRLFGYDDAKELDEIPVLNLINKSDHARVKEWFRKTGRNPQDMQAGEITVVKKDGTRFPAEVTISAIQMNGENWHQISVTDISRRKNIEDQLQFTHDHDPLTGLYNRSYFLQVLGEATAAAQAGKQIMVLLHLDLQRLREINDAHGYSTGDRLITRVADLLRKSLGDHDILARFSGDEFTALLPDSAGRPAMDAAAAIRRMLTETNLGEEGKTFVCHWTLSTTVIDASVAGAEQAVALAYRGHAEREPRPAVAISAAPSAPREEVAAASASVPAARPSATVHHIDRATNMAKSIEAALRTESFQLLYQPIVNLHGDTAENYEALLRMSGSGGELIAAAEFMPVAREAGLSRELDRMVVKRVIAALRDLRAAGRQPTLFVNLSQTALDDEELPILILESLRSSGVKGKSLVFEINESILSARTDETSAFITSQRKIGCRFAADDFGRKGITAMPRQTVDFIKVDNELLRPLISDKAGQVIVKGLFAAASRDNRRIIVKNVEDAASLSALWAYGIEYVQGNYFQAPDASLSYEFASESIDSDQATAGWTRQDH